MNELENKKILVVDDEAELLNMLKDILYNGGYSYVYTAADCRAALKAVGERQIALCILDVNLPDGDGFTLYRDIKAIRDVPAIFLTARGEATDRLQGLGLGADDYMVKPFLGAELLLRVTAVLRRSYLRPASVTAFSLGDRLINLEKAQVVWGNKTLPVRAKELILLKKLWENKNRIVTNDALCMAAWGDSYYGYENTLMVHIHRLRQKIEANPSKPVYLLTVKGLGYKLVINSD